MTSYSYNGLGDRLSQTVNGVTTNYTLDLNAGLTQVLNDGANAYIYGVGRIAQVNTSGTEYFLGDALGSVRQLADLSRAITYSRAYDPYGVVTSTTGTSSTTYGYTGEAYGESTQLTYLRSRYYASGTGRFLTSDPSKLETNTYLYAKGNPVNRIDPSGYYSKELISQNIGMMEFWRGTHPHWGFYAMLRNAKDYSNLNIGYVDLMQQQYPDVFWSYQGYFYTINCKTIMIGGQTLREFYESKILSRNIPGIWWRDTSAMYYELPGFDYTRLESVPGKVFVDGDRESSFPLFHSLSLGIMAFGLNPEFNIVSDVDGNKYLGISGSIRGITIGVGYTEGYLCGWGSACIADLSPSEVESAIAGICLGPEGMFFAGMNLSLICNGFPFSLGTSFSSVTTFYIGLEFGGTPLGGSIMIPLSRFGVAPNPKLGWRWALVNERNGVTYDKILAAGG